MIRLGYAAKGGTSFEEADGADRDPAAEPLPPVVAGGRVRTPRCSFAQEQFWFVDQLTPGNVAYNFSWPIRLRGTLDTIALDRAFAEVIRRHESLRTGFSVEDGQPVQVIDPVSVFTLERVDVSGESRPEEVAQRLVDVETRRPFDLRSPRLFRARLIRLSEADHILQIVVHHIVFDEWSKVVLYRELSTLYEAFSSGRPSPLPEAMIQYGDFAEWQRTWLTEAALQEDLAHWASELEGAPSVLDLPSDRPRPSVASLRGGRRRLPLPPELTSALDELARREGATFFEGLLALFQLLLQRYTGEEDFVVGVPVDNRNRPELDDIIGVLLNTVVIRSDLAGSPSFRTMLRRVHTRVLAATAHLNLPFELLIRELQPVRDLSRHPLYQVLLAINPLEPSLQLPGIDTEEMDTEVTAAGVDLFLFLQERAGGFDALWEYSTDLFDRRTIDRIHAHLVRLLQAVVDDPNRCVDELPMLSEDERQLLLVEWNNTDADYPRATLHGLVEAQAKRSPDAVAVIFEQEQLTHGELDARANQLARQLRDFGVGPDSLVAISLQRSLDLVVGLLGILKAGGAYLPLDPDLPQERLAFMLNDSRADVLLSLEPLLAQLPPFAGRIVCLDTDWPEIASQSTAGVDVVVGDSDLAYVIYTSGSTGRPKGVLNTHRGIVNRLLSMQDTYRLENSDRLLQKTQSSFDVAVREVFWPLLFGACLVVASPGEHGNPSYLADVIERERVTTLHFVPSMLQLFLDQVEPAKCHSLRCVLCGGEPLPADLVRRFFERFECELHNLYGPTEAAVSVTTWRCNADDPKPVVPIGRPVANTQVYVLDSRLNPAPVGVWGELLIGGVQVARGYHERPELTAERFIANPFGAGRLYRTGDLGRWNAEGALEFGGRIDNQVKLRGFRIELGEIEVVLREHEAVAESAVIAVESGVGQSELAAYVVLEPGWRGKATIRPDFTSYLRTKLPDYMVPSSVTSIDALPLLPNGKLDRSALPTPERSIEDDGSSDPETALEQVIAGVWSELLGLERVGRNDNFFALGGHSLLAARIIARLSKEFEVELSLRSFLQEPTIAALAREIEASDREPELQLPPLLPRNGIRDCSFAQERFWFVDQVMGQNAAYNIPVGLRIRGELRISILEHALSEIVRRHEVLRTRFSVEDGRPRQIVEPARPICVQVVNLEGLGEVEREQTAQRFVDTETQTPFELTRSPLFRVHLLRLGERHHILHFVFNHLVFDGWSKEVLFRELTALYDAFLREDPSPLPELTVQYGDFSEWQRSWMQGELLEQELVYWTESLNGIPTALELPTDRPRPAISSMSGAWSRSTVPARTVEALQAVARREGATLYMALLAVFDLLLHRYTGQADVVVGMPVDSRDRPELDDAIGVFVDTVVLRVDLSGNVSYRELLDRVRKRTLDAIAHKRLPFERLVRALQPDRQLGRHPLYQVMLTLVPAASPLELADLQSEEIKTERASAPIDLTVFLEQQGSELEAIWEYSTDLFDPETIGRMQAHFLRLLDAVASEPDRPIDELEMLTDAERRHLLEASNGAAVDYPVACLHELFEAQVAAAPDATAVSYEGEGISYRELNERANRLAHRLRELGVRPETPVALCLHRSLEMVVGILGVLKAGGAYVPLDPAYPADRLSFVLADTRAPVLITEVQLLRQLPVHDATVLCLDRDASALSDRSIANPEALARPENLAYIIYTSGSTGQPKGVQVEHRHVARLFAATEEWFGFGPSDTWTLVHSYAFDFSVWELWGALLYGGRLVVAPLWTTRTPQALASLVAEERVTVLNVTPSLFVSAQEELLRLGERLALRHVVFGGEALQPSALRPWFKRFEASGPALVNMYGITETTVHVTYRPLTAADCDRDGSPIGRPIPDLQVFLLDEHLNPSPPGIPGELFVGGAGVARGYLNRPELTAERFVPNPFGAGRLYRSGDSARYRDDGELEFLGRIDDQVKIRGYRIEPGEIQSALLDHEAVAEAAVIAHEAATGDTRLAAYVVPSAETAGVVRRVLHLQTEGRLSAGRVLELPGGTAVVTDGTEAELVHESIVDGRVYLRHGIEIPADACVLDIGAGIGLFSMLVNQLSPGARIFAFEASEAAHQALALNVEIHEMRAVALDWIPAGVSQHGQPLATEPIEPVPTISNVLQQHNVERVDLIKVSLAEGELEILGGIDAADWPRIQQVVVDVHDDDATLNALTRMLDEHGLSPTVEQDELAPGAGVRTVFAHRSSIKPAPRLNAPSWRGAEQLRSDLREHLEERLPAFMVPSSLTLLTELPLTPNGKLDRGALLAPAGEEQTEAAFIAPRTTTEVIIAEIWREILGVERVGATDNFFNLGGHSLLAARVVTRVREHFAMDLSVRALFEHPTLSGFAEHVKASGAEIGEDMSPVEDGPIDIGAPTTYPPSFPQQQLLFIDKLAPDIATYNGALAIRVVGELDHDALEGAIADVIERHEALRTIFTWKAEGPAQVVLDRWQFALPVVELAQLPDGRHEAELQRLLRAEARQPFDLEGDLPLRATLFRRDVAEHVLLVLTHHIASDGWSVGVFCRDLGEFYDARMTSRPPRLPALPLQYLDFSLWQRGRLRGERLASEIANWRAKLAGAPTLLHLPTDYPRPRQQTFAGASHHVVLPRIVAENVMRLCREEKVTPYMLLLSVFGVLLYRLTGQDDILVGSPFANRARSEFDQLIGFFANTLVMRVRLGDNPAFTGLLTRVRETALEAFDHQELPFEQVVEAVRPQRDLGFNPLVQVNFRVRVEPPPKPELHGTTTSTVRVDAGFAAFDLALDLHVLDDGIEAEFIYNEDLFEISSIERLAADFDGLLRQVLQEPQARLLSLELPSDHGVAAGGSPTPGTSIRRFRETSRSGASVGHPSPMDAPGHTAGSS